MAPVFETADRAILRRCRPGWPSWSTLAARSLFAGSTGAYRAVPGRRSARRGVRRRRRAPGDARSTSSCSGSRTTPGIYGRRQDMFVKYLARSGRVRHHRPLRQPDDRRELVPDVPARAGRAPTSAASWCARRCAGCCTAATSRASTATRSSSADGVSRTARPARRRALRRLRAVRPRRARASGPGRRCSGSTRPTTTSPSSSTRSTPTSWWPTSSTTTAPGTSRARAHVRAHRAATTARCWPAATSSSPTASRSRRACAQFAPDVHVVAERARAPRRPTRRAPRARGAARAHRSDHRLRRATSRRASTSSCSRRSPGPDPSGTSSSSAPRTSTARSWSSTGCRTCTSSGSCPTARRTRSSHHVDVALIPHVDNEMTRSMNPLKAFVYCVGGRAGGVDPGRQPRRVRRPHHGRRTVPRLRGRHRGAPARPVGRVDPEVLRAALLGTSGRAGVRAGRPGRPPRQADGPA